MNAKNKNSLRPNFFAITSQVDILIIELFENMTSPHTAKNKNAEGYFK